MEKTIFEKDYILLIMNCKKYIEKAKFQKKTWLKYLPKWITYYHVIGDEELQELYNFNEEENILFIKVKDDYNSLPKKVIQAYQAVINRFNLKYIFKTDDDQILCNKNFFDILLNVIKYKRPSPHYGGYIVNVPQNYLSKYYTIHPELPTYLPVLKTRYCSGRFYFLSREAIEDLTSKEKKIKISNEYLEDYAIGYNLDEKYKTNMLKLETNKFFTDIELSDFIA